MSKQYLFGRTFLFFLVFLTFCIGAQGQQTINVSGIVSGAEDGIPLPGATVLIKGTTTGTVTGVNGKYTLQNVPPDAMLVFSFVGRLTEEQQVNGRTVIDITLVTDVTSLDEVVVVGYGTQRKRDVTGSIVSVKGEDLQSKPLSNPISLLQGSIPGVVVTNRGAAGESPYVRIRGVGSISNTNPLFIVDGIFTDNVDFVNPNDITSMEILKDPSSLAMFGVQGANGVIIISTKRAKKGETNINVNSYAGYQEVTNKIKVTNAEEFKMLYNEEMKNRKSPEYDFSRYTANTDWQDLVLRKAFITNNNISVSSGTDNNQIAFNINYFKQEGVLKYEDYQRITAHLNDEMKVNKFLKVGCDINFSRWDKNPATADLASAVRALPVEGPMVDTGAGAGRWYSALPALQSQQLFNPVANMEIFKGKTINQGYRLVGSAFAELNFLKYFTWKSVFYTDLGFSEKRTYTPKYFVGDSLSPVHYNTTTGIAEERYNYPSWQVDHTLTYSNTFRTKHSVKILAGMTAQYDGERYIKGDRQGINIDILDDPIYWYLDVGTPNINEHNSSGGKEQSFISYLFRVNYAYANKYLLNLSYRRDGTSKFSPSHQWGNFPSVGAGWVLSEESFMKSQQIFDFVKLRVSWGMLGNDKIGDYLYYPLLNTGVNGIFGENVYPAARLDVQPDEDIHWEVVKGTDAGIEFTALNRRLKVESDYYDRKTNDILVQIQVPGPAGVVDLLTNAGTILNRGVEISLNWTDNITNNLTYRIGGNLTTIHNEVLSIGDNVGYNITNGPARTTVGQPIGAFYGYVQEGVFQNQAELDSVPHLRKQGVGDLRFKDLDGNDTLNTKDRTFLGSPTPDLTYGISLGLSYKNFDLNIDMQGVAGNYIYRQWATANWAVLNYPAGRLERWHGEGTSNSEPILNSKSVGYYENSSYWVDKGDYFRIRNIYLGYNFGSRFCSHLRLKGGKIYLNIQNLKTFSNAVGYSPEVGGDNPTHFGVDDITYPIPATYSIGLNVNL
jgi:TonB-linked SusC/RagA family outer membrane protein